MDNLSLINELHGWYFLDTGWGCGGVKVNKNIVEETAPIFKSFKGQDIKQIVGRSHYHIERVDVVR